MALVQIQAYDPEAFTPSSDIISVLESGVSQQIRRVEIYEADATTRWHPDPTDQSFNRLVDGSVNVDYNSDERRKLDLTLDNEDKLLRPNPNGGFWYDKVIKVFRGVRYDPSKISPTAAVIESDSANDYTVANDIASVVKAAGFKNTDLQLGVTDQATLTDYSWLISAMHTSVSGAGALLNAMWGNGKNILTFGVGNNATVLPHYSTYNAPANIIWGIKDVTADTPVKNVFTGGLTESAGAATGTAPTALASGAMSLSVWSNTPNPQFITAAMIRNSTGAVWVDIRLPVVTGTLAKKLVRTILNFVRNQYTSKVWEVQLGEFYIDNISESNFPHSIKVTARDATKKMMNSKLARTASFVVGTRLDDFVIGQAALSGIPVAKMRMNMADETLTTELSFDKGTSRWDMVKSALNSFNYEFFMNGQGFFVVRPFNDPTLGAIDFTFKTGTDGNLVSFERSTNDSRIFNVVQVTATPSDNADVPLSYFGEARNDDLNSPTNTTRLGERVMTVDAPWLSSDFDCANLAATYLKISALESYEMNFSAIYYPFLEAGSIIALYDPEAYSFEPTRFLMDSLDYNLGLGPMSATAKRVTLVGEAN